MLNHARTLLLNISYEKFAANNYLGGELIDKGFRKVTYPTFIEKVRNALFGESPDRNMLEYRVKQLMTLLHASPLRNYVTDLDPRVSYDLTWDSFIKNNVFKPKITALSGTEVDALGILGEPSIPDAKGLTTFEFEVDILTGTTVRVKCVKGIPYQIIHNFTLTNNRSDTLPLRYTGYSFVMNTDNPGAGWRVSIVNRPRYDMTVLLSGLESIGDTNCKNVFGNISEEPFKTFWTIWENRKEDPLRLSAFLLAYVYRMEALR